MTSIGVGKSKHPSKSTAISLPTDSMTLWNHYFSPNTILEAVDILSVPSSNIRVMGGGTDLLLDLQQKRTPPPDGVVDVTEIHEMRRLEIRGNELFVGAAVPLREIVSSPLVYQHGRALHEAAKLIGGPQVRNVATLGGNVAHALPAADGTIALIALGARAEIASCRGVRQEPVEALFAGPGRTMLSAQDILVGFYILLQESMSSSYFLRVMRPQGVALPIINTAIWLERESEVISEIRIAIGPSGPVPRRASNSEKFLSRKTFHPGTLNAIDEIVLEDVRFRSSKYRSSADYRNHLVSILIRNCLTKAWSETFIG